MHPTRPLFFALFVLVFTHCKHEAPEPDPVPEPPVTTPVDTLPVDSTDLLAGTTPVPASPPQRPGDPQAGWDYLTTGDYVSSGIPYTIYTLGAGTGANLLNRTGDNASIPFDFTAVDAPNGVRVVAANCLQCHAQKMDNQLIVGLGNSLVDFTADQGAGLPNLDLAITGLYGVNSPEYAAYFPFRRAVAATSPYIRTHAVGANPADKLATVLAAHRDPDDLTWKSQPNWPLELAAIPSDVPAWWLLKKKHALFATASGRGDFARIMMASGLLTLENEVQAAAIDDHFDDVLAYLYSLEAPTYPGPIDAQLAGAGEEVFRAHCAHCHGDYGPTESYPNLLVDLDVVGTDPALAQAFQARSEFTDWYNNSWFAQPPYAAQMVNQSGYLAPPLDGIWATAPYLHNGSVPTLETLLNSSTRPAFWRRNGPGAAYDLQAVGWDHSQESFQVDKWTYPTDIEGYGNQGHTFGDALTDQERTAVLEYLKTL